MSKRPLTRESERLLRAMLLNFMRENGVCRGWSDKKATDAAMELLKKGFIRIEMDEDSDSYTVVPCQP